MLVIFDEPDASHPRDGTAKSGDDCQGLAHGDPAKTCEAGLRCCSLCGGTPRPPTCGETCQDCTNSRIP